MYGWESIPITLSSQDGCLKIISKSDTVMQDVVQPLITIQAYISTAWNTDLTRWMNKSSLSTAYLTSSAAMSSTSAPHDSRLA